MTDNQYICRAKAKGRTELLAVVVFLLLLGGATAEYRRATMPLAFVSFIFEAGNRMENTVLPKTVDDSVAVEVKTSASRKINDKKDREVSENFRQNLSAFLDYIKEIKEKNAALQKPESALNKIHQSEQVNIVSPTVPQHAFAEGKIEIYDSEKGVIAVENTQKSAKEENKSQERVMNETVAEAVKTELVGKTKDSIQKNTPTETEELALSFEQSPENKGENNVSAEDAPLDLMKTIAKQPIE